MKYLEISGSKLFDIPYIKKFMRVLKHAPCVEILENLDIKGLMQGIITNVSFADAMVFTITTAENIDSIMGFDNFLSQQIEKLALSLIEKEIVESDELEKIVSKRKISTKIPTSI